MNELINLIQTITGHLEALADQLNNQTFDKDFVKNLIYRDLIDLKKLEKKVEEYEGRKEI